ncbi:hypothetical protein B0H13DRAFT_1637057 [Mycena leptocephala]|nr:hypothetical protein B0H13DRAFT_1637057 [Mycena leptocephala]
MGFWEPATELGWFCGEEDLPCEVTADTIFYLDALCVAPAFEHVDPEFELRKIVVYTDNTNTVDIFNSLCALPAYNSILTSSIDVLFDSEFDIRVLYVEGEKPGR